MDHIRQNHERIREMVTFSESLLDEYEDYEQSSSVKIEQLEAEVFDLSQENANLNKKIKELEDKQKLHDKQLEEQKCVNRRPFGNE